MGIVIFGISVSLGKIFAKKHGYKIDSNQVPPSSRLQTTNGMGWPNWIMALIDRGMLKELWALGLTETLASFFHTWPCCAGLARSAVYEAAGAKTQARPLFQGTLECQESKVVSAGDGVLERPAPHCPALGGPALLRSPHGYPGSGPWLHR